MIIYGRFSFAVACIATCLTDHAIDCSNEDFRLLKHNAVEIGLSTFRSNRTTRRMEATNCAETWLLTCQPTLRHIPEDGIYHQTAMRISHISTALTKRIQVM